MYKFFFATFIAFLINTPIFAQFQDSAITSRIESYLTQMEKVGFSGTVLVELGGNKIVSKGYGFRDIKNQLKNEPTTVFNINSVTKQFTAAAILKLEMQGKLSTDDKIAKYFTNLPKDKANITIHDLLRHQSGLVSNIGSNYEEINKDKFTSKAFATKPLFQPGTQFSYSNIGYSLLAIIIEKTSGTSYEDYLYNNLFKPAGMEQTGTTRAAFNPNNVAIGYYGADSVWGKPTEKYKTKNGEYWNTTGNGSLLSSTEDLYKWHLALIFDRILSAAQKQKLYHPVLRTSEDQRNYYAYGWDVHTTARSTTKLWHNGVNNVLYADFKRFINDGVSIITLSNKSNQNIFDAKISDDIERIIFEKNFTPTIPVAETNENIAFTNQIINTIIEKGLQSAKDQYLKRSKSTDLISYLVNSKGYDLLDNNKTDKAIAMFELNVFVFPTSADAWDSLAEAYLKQGDKRAATKFYQKSLEINPFNENAKEMLKKLK